MNDTKNKRTLINFFLTITLISSIANFVITLLFKNDKNLLIDSISNLFICVFTIFFIFSAISNRRKYKNYIAISSFMLIVFNTFSIASTLNLLSFMQLPHVDDFTNKSLVEVIKWSKKNKIEVDQIYEYSDTVDEYKIINQSVAPSTILKNTKKLTVTVSEGKDPDKEVIIPDMEGWMANRVLKYITNNNLGNVKVEFIKSDKIRDTLIEQSKSGNIRRSDEINLKFSIGDESLDDIKFMNLKNKDLFEAEFYLKRNGIKYEIQKEFSTKVGRNKIIKTNIKPGKLIKASSDEKIILTVSKGKKIKVPNLKKYSMLKITEWVIKNKLKLEFNSKYDDKIAANKVISANYKKGDIIEQKTIIQILVSKGKLIMKEFTNIDEFRDWANKYNINYEEQFEFSNDVDEGKIISFSHKTGDTIKNDDIITVILSKGKKTKIPNVVGATKTEAIKKLENAKIKFNFVYDYSTKDKNTVIKQSLQAGSEVGENTTITLTLSNGKKEPEKRQSTNYNTNNSGNNKNYNPPKTSESSCNNNIKETIYLYPELLDTTNPNGTCSKIKSRYSNMKFSCSIDNYGVGKGLVANSTSINGKTFSQCDTILLKISNG